MRRPLKIIVRTLGVTLGVLLILALYLVVSFDPNNYRADITARVQAETGRTLTFQDDIKLQLFPWIGLKLGATLLSGPESFRDQGDDQGDEQPFLTIRSASIKARLLPLFQQRLEIDTIALHGLQVNLISAVNGDNNWDFSDSGSGSASSALPPPADTEAQITGSASPDTAAATLAGLTINGLDVQDATINWFDASTQTRLTLGQLTLTSGAIDLGDPGTPIDIDLSFNLSGKPLAKQPLAIRLITRSTLNLEEQTIQLARLTLQVGDLLVSGGLQAAQLNSSPTFSGQLDLSSFNPRPLLQQLGITLPETQDPSVLQDVSAILQFEGDAHQVDVTELNIHLDETSLVGEAQLALDLHQPSSFTLAIDRLDIDRYLPPSDNIPAASGSATAKPASVTPTSATLDLPLELLRTLNLQGQVRMGAVKVAGLRASNITVTLSAKDALLRLQPLQADLYQGRVKGKLQLDARSARPRFSLQTRLDDFQAEPFLRDLLDSDLISGQTALRLDLVSQGNSLDELTRSLNGKANVSFTDGAIKGFNIAAMVRSAQAKIKKRPAPEAAVKQTDFTDLTASLRINNGIVTNQDLSAQAPFLRISGQGKADLVNETIDYRLSAKVVKAAQGQGGADLASLHGTTIPILIRGPLTDPEIKLDSAVIKNKLRQKAQQEIKKELQKQQDDIKTRLQDQVRDKLKQKLKKFF